jgi:nucleotide-binding universal stress UspA family protein
MTRNILVGVDGSESALQATRWAAREAVRRDTDVRLVHVRQFPLLLPPEDMFAKELTDQGRKWLSAARDIALGIAPDIDVHTELRTGQPGEELVAETEDAQLVVVGSRGLGGFRSLLLGSVANALAAHGHCPVVVLRGRTVGAPAPDHGPVVVGTGGTPSSEAAVEFAFAAAAARGAEVIAVDAWAYEGLVEARSPVPLTMDRAERASLLDEIAAVQHRAFEEQLAKPRAAYPDLVVRGVHYRGRPVDGILEQAEHAQLVVVGAHGRHPAWAGAVGSTSYAVLHHAICPVAVVRHHNPPE